MDPFTAGVILGFAHLVNYTIILGTAALGVKKIRNDAEKQKIVTVGKLAEIFKK